MPMLAIVPPPRFKRGRRITLSSAVSFGRWATAPGSRMLLWESFAGSEKATHRASFGSMLTPKIESCLDAMRVAVGGGGMLTSSSIGWTSLLKGGRIDPENPGQPYDPESVNLVFGAFAVFPCSNTLESFFASGCDLFTKRYPSSRPRALQKSSSFDHFAMVGDMAPSNRSSSMNGRSTTHNQGIALPFGSTGTSLG